VLLKKVKSYLLLIVIMLPFTLKAQSWSNMRLKKILVTSDSLKIDSLSIIPNSLMLSDSIGNKIDTASFYVDYAKALVIFKNKDLSKTVLVVKYRVFPYDFSKQYYHRDYSKIKKRDSSANPNYFFIFQEEPKNIWDLGGLNKSGSISRGVSFGNNQDVFVNSSLNLQLSGKLSDEIDILAVITDQNIPVQPEGNTQQIQEFDKVFIQLSDKNSKLIAGDFEMQRPQSYFMSFNKKSQGLMLSSSFKTSKKPEKTDKTSIVSGIALSKGKFSRNQIDGVEGNQGPYQLKGNDNEMYIVVIAGTEKVYIDGELLVRGQENDYVMDYNLGQLFFTPQRQITKDSRILVEFEYTDINYTRSLVFVGNEWELKKCKLRLNYYSEQDIKNQPIQFDLNDEEKRLMAGIGDSLQDALSYNIDSIAFNGNQVLYKMVDSLGYDSVFVYSINPDSAHYRLGFTNVGLGNGNYVQINTIANGRVFKWVQPLNNQPQGSYEPIILLVTPKKKQMLTLATDYFINKKTKFFIETAFSNNDINLFSDRDKADDNGYAAKVGLVNKQSLWKENSKEWSFVSEINTEIVDKLFTPIERYRNVEFERDWNLTNLAIKENEYISTLKLTLINKNNEFVNYSFIYFLKGDAFEAHKNSFDLNLNHRKLYYTFNGSYLKSSYTIAKSDYFKHRTGIVRKFKFFSTGIKEEQENNKIKDIVNNSLSANSFSFFQGEAFISNPDSANNAFNLFYKRRYDWQPVNDTFKMSTLGEIYGFSGDVFKNSKNGLSLSGAYRKLSIYDTLISKDEASRSLLGRLEYFTEIWKGFIRTTGFYEIGSGVEIKKEFTYIEVAAGQGIYSWSDYNNNGIKELNEFEIAIFQDQANYIKIYIPTDQTIKTYINQYNQTLAINPSAILKKSNAIKKLICRFYYTAVYNVDRKVTDNDPLIAYNPFNKNINDSVLVSINSAFRNTLFFNRTNAVFGMDVNYQKSNNRILLVNGFDTRLIEIIGVKIRWNINQVFSFFLVSNMGNKKSSSEFLQSRDYNILYYETEPTFNIQTNNMFRIGLFYKYTDKQNTAGILNEKTILHKMGTELKYNILAKSSMVGRFTYIKADYNSDENTSIAFEMLEGFNSGENYTWNISYQRNLSDNLQLNVNYDGRKSASTKTIHVGTVQLRAYF
jgi:hypothetical protein